MLREFQTFDNKAKVIKLDTGVTDQLAKMIKKWLLPKKKLAVGKLEYKTCCWFATEHKRDRSGEKERTKMSERLAPLSTYLLCSFYMEGEKGCFH